MIELFDRRTGKQLDISDMSRREFMSLVYSPVLVEYQLFYSKIILEALEYYKDAPLVEHKITEDEKRKAIFEYENQILTGYVKTSDLVVEGFNGTIILIVFIFILVISIIVSIIVATKKKRKKAKNKT